MLDLSTLNSEQLEAVKDFDNNLLILACAGSGKTKTITSKIAYAIENGIMAPYQICAVTFTNRAAKEMRDRVSALLPETDTSKMVIKTFHSLGASLLRLFGEDVGLNRDFSIYDDEDSLQLLKAALNDKYDTKELKQFQKSISKAKDLGMDPDSMFLKDVNDSPIFRSIFKSYEERLRRTGNVDFSDLIGRAAELLRTSERALSYCHNRFRMVLVDEYQDSNKEQFEFLRLFKGDNTLLAVVGDDDQSIYSFRGAEVENILSFASSFKGVREIKLEKNYRSTDEILRPAGALIKNNLERHVKDIVSADGKKGSKPAVICSLSGQMEAERIASIIERNGDYSSTAILYRTNAQSMPFETVLTKKRIPYHVVGALKFYDREEIKDCVAFLRLLLNHGDEISFKRIINKPSRGIGYKKIEEILSYGGDIFQDLEIYNNSHTGEAQKGTLRFYNAWKEAETDLDKADDNLGNLLLRALHNTGLADYYDSEKDKTVRESKNQNLSQLVNILAGTENSDYSSSLEIEIEENVGREALRSFLERITLDTTVLGNEDEKDNQGVTLITMHNTKGLEFDTVFCAGLEQEIIPGRNADLPKSKEEERRILYVAMTRARKNLYLSYASQRMMWGHTNYSRPSVFLRDIPPQMLSGDVENIYSSSSIGNSFSSFKSKFDQKPVFTTPSWVKNTDVTPKPKREEKIVTFNIGDRVHHFTNGNGKITEREVRSDKTIITVVFDSGKRMKFVEGHAALEKLS